MGKKNASKLLAENIPRGQGHGFTRLRVAG